MINLMIARFPGVINCAFCKVDLQYLTFLEQAKYFLYTIVVILVYNIACSSCTLA